MKRIAVLTSGGDAPGMNAAIRAVVRTGLNRGWEVIGFEQGFIGLISGNAVPLGPREVGGIIQRGGTVLGSARCPDFKTRAAQLKAVSILREHDIEGLVVIGGNGSQTGSYALSQMDFPVVGVASTIDNDLYGSEMTIGVDTALNIALEALDRLKNTASSLQRAFILEVMGRDCGYLALMTAIAGGAEAVVIPEVKTVARSLPNGSKQPTKRESPMRSSWSRKVLNITQINSQPILPNTTSGLALTSGRQDWATFSGEATPGRLIGFLPAGLGAAATDQLERGEVGVLVGLIKGEIKPTPLSEVVANKKPLDLHLLELARSLD